MRIINQFLKEVRSFEKKDSVKALIFCPHEKILLVRRQNDQGGGGNWDLPGGGIEKGENEKDALKREIFEEVGLNVDNISKVKTVNLKIPEHGINSNMHVYKCNTENMDVQLKPATWKGSDGKPEHTEYLWIDKKIDLENRPMLDQLKKIVMDNLK